MTSASPTADFAPLRAQFEGELHTGRTMRLLYATDASEYQEVPAAVAFPRTEADLGRLIGFARRHGLGLVPRTAGTSLAGQVVGHGIVVDLGRHFNRILAIDPVRRRVRVQPGVVRNELNLALKPHGLFFTPETSTANRAMIGGMVGNNSCGANSIVYGATRDHVVSIRGFLSDGSEVTLGPMSAAEMAARCDGGATLDANIHRAVRDLLGPAENRRRIRDHFPKPGVTRRNTGYALDALMDCAAFDPASKRPFNFCQLVAGSEGTLFLGVEFELNCEWLPPPGGLMCAHFATIAEALQATLITMRHHPFGCELIDRHILECTKSNLEQAKNRFFVQGDPGAVLVIEFRHEQREWIEQVMRHLRAEFQAAGLGYAYPLVWGDNCNRVWELRRAGQGIMTNVVGDAKPREVVEDTAVAVADLPAYIAEFDALMRDKYGIACVYYAHAGAGELHTRPLFNLKTGEGLRMFRGIATDIAALVKKYRGSLSGEHGDGRLRGEFIRFMVGDECYAFMRQVKEAFDPLGVFNPGKIVDTPPMDTSLRHAPDHPNPEYETIFDFGAVQGVLRAAEKCNGSGDCRKSHLMGGTMCPSFMATRNEKDTTRARANMLRHVLTHPPDPTRPFDSEELADVMDLCLSCKGCRSECPSNVDLTRLKAEWLQHYLDAHGVPLRSRLVANFGRAMRLAARFPSAYNWIVSAPDLSRWIKRAAGFASARSLPSLPTTTVRAWHARHGNRPPRPDSGPVFPHGKVHLFCDEFTDTTDARVGIAAIRLLNALGYEVVIPPQTESGRAHLSKGLVREARLLAERNVALLDPVVSADAPLIGIEPSALLGFRDEFPDLVRAPLKPAARRLAGHALLIDEFIAREAQRGNVRSEAFLAREQVIKLHGHCHQKALGSVAATVQMLQLPRGHRVEVIPSGCCGMAGSFGYESEHFALSQQIGELVLFPAVRAAADAVIAAPGTSCRHQILDGTGRVARHPVEILADALV
ncbi:MAG TPA: FAD-linked oxidase C-terminal domain-containing protein [Candidatus Didemnitutus sp.]|jgi:FAD/FMN-containing dehydrogenase/Fe-S oxidoreductase